MCRSGSRSLELRKGAVVFISTLLVLSAGEGDPKSPVQGTRGLRSCCGGKFESTPHSTPHSCGGSHCACSPTWRVLCGIGARAQGTLSAIRGGSKWEQALHVAANRWPTAFAVLEQVSATMQDIFGVCFKSPPVDGGKLSSASSQRAQKRSAVNHSWSLSSVGDEQPSPQPGCEQPFCGVHSLSLTLDTSVHGQFQASLPSLVPTFDIKLDCLPEGAPAEKVQVVLHHRFCRTRRADIEKGIEEEWTRLTRLDPRMWWYDGTLFRLASSQRWLDADGTQEVKLECGVTRYRSFLGTNMAPDCERIPAAHLSNPLSSVALVHTADRAIVFIRPTSDADDDGQPLFSLPGGHASADRAGMFDSMVQVPIPSGEGQEVTCLYKFSVWPGCERWRPQRAVLPELFDCPVREACQSLGLSRHHFTQPPLLFGITQSKKNRITAAVFYLKSSLTAQQVMDYHSRARSTAKSANILAVPEKEALPSIDIRLPGCSRGALYLFSQWRVRHLRVQRSASGIPRAVSVPRDEDDTEGDTPHKLGEWLEGGSDVQSVSVPRRGGGVEAAQAKETLRVSLGVEKPLVAGANAVAPPASVREGVESQAATNHSERSRSQAVKLKRPVRVTSREESPARMISARDAAALAPAHPFKFGLSKSRSHHDLDGDARGDEAAWSDRESPLPTTPRGRTQRRKLGGEDESQARAERPKKQNKELVAAFYWWLSTWQDPRTMKKAARELGLNTDGELAEAEMSAIMERRLAILDGKDSSDSSSSSSSSSSDESGDDSMRERERDLLRAHDAAKKKRKRKRDKAERRKEEKKEKEKREQDRRRR